MAIENFDDLSFKAGEFKNGTAKMFAKMHAYWKDIKNNVYPEKVLIEKSNALSQEIDAFFDFVGRDNFSFDGSDVAFVGEKIPSKRKNEKQ